VAARVHVRAACVICGAQSCTGEPFFRVLRFPLAIIIPRICPPSSSPGAGTLGLLVAAVPSGPNWTPLPRYINLIFFNITEDYDLQCTASCALSLSLFSLVVLTFRVFIDTFNVLRNTQ
jgi:hypothetical protein